MSGVYNFEAQDTNAGVITRRVMMAHYSPDYSAPYSQISIMATGASRDCVSLWATS